MGNKMGYSFNSPCHTHQFVIIRSTFLNTNFVRGLVGVWVRLMKYITNYDKMLRRLKDRIVKNIDVLHFISIPDLHFIMRAHFNLLHSCTMLFSSPDYHD